MMRLASHLILLLPALLTAGQIPDVDRRNTEIRHTDMHYSFEAPARSRLWTERAEFLRKQILFSAGLLPTPEKAPLNPQVFGRVEHEDYSIEKVLLEVYPEFYLGANLYRPVGKRGPFPAVASPHGHWRYGRLENQQLNSVPARGISLARQGYVVLTYDMVGYTDTRQLPHTALGGKREEMWGVGLLGVQLWNGIRVLDFLESLPDIDAKRIGVTGASGGATQAMMLQAVDERIAFSSPVNMVSGLMQGGSPCENAPNLRIDTNNIEIAALMAPRPMLVVSANGDWTRNVPREEFPALQKVYQLLRKPQAVEVVQFDSPHNYHQQSREAVYKFFGKTVLGDESSDFTERNFTVEQLSDLMALWGRELPAGAVDEQTFIKQRIGEADGRIEALKPRDRASLERARGEFRSWLELATMAQAPAANFLASDLVDTLDNGEQVLIGRRGRGDRIPAVLLRPQRVNGSVNPTLIVHPEGSAWVMSSGESRYGLVAQILAGGGSVMGIDAFQTAYARQPRDIAAAGERAERYFTTFNRSDTANRIQDVLTAITYARTRLGSQHINLVCMGEAGPWCVLARAMADGPLDLVADFDRVNATSEAELADKLFVPHLLRSGGFRAAATLLTAGNVRIFNVGGGFPQDWLNAAATAVGSSLAAELRAEPAGDEEILGWLGIRTSTRR